VLDRLGVATPADVDAMALLARAWAAVVPFDNVAKTQALRSGATNPEGDAAALCRRWLDTGRGGTCWSHVAALCGLARHGGLGASASLERALWRTPPDEIDLHGGVVVTVDGRRWLYDPVHTSTDPLELEPGARGTWGPLEVGIDAPDDGALQHWFRRPGMDEPNVYRVLSTVLDDVDVAAFVRIAEDHTGVPGSRLIWRVAPPEAVVRVRQSDDAQHWERVVHTVEGTEVTRYAGSTEAFVAAGARDAQSIRRLVDELWPPEEDSDPAAVDPLV
jgi:hypothetical protein